MLSIILLSIAGAVIAAVVGTLWYSNKTPMGKIHMQYLGFDKLSDDEKRMKMEQAKPMMVKMYSAQMLLSLLTAFATVFIVVTGTRNGLPLSYSIGFIVLNWFCFVVPTIGTGIIWSNCDRSIAWKKFFSDSFEVLVVLVITALLASLFA